MSEDIPAAQIENLRIENGTGDRAQPVSPPKTPTGDSPMTFQSAFRAFSKFGDSKSDGKHITLSQSDKWMKQAKVIDGKKISTTDTGIYFKKLKSLKVTPDDYNKFLDDLAKNKKVDLEEMKNKMSNCGAPGLTGTTPGKSAATVERLTDTSKYTGSHKQRFDETGKGKGISGRKDIVDGSGYVSGYHNKDSFGKN
ncbi:hypothetical protein FQA39_LY01762 [Lamprigera yunnana]|nr:hypothetical protein FQA39_LY01762 [Lamprigera yunnana]